MKAFLIGEKSAGMTAVEIEDENQTLVWSFRWFQDGASRDGYLEGLKDAIETMRQCEKWKEFDGGDFDDDGAPVCFDQSPTTGKMLSFDGKTWLLEEDAFTMGNQSREIVDAAIIAGLVESDEEIEIDETIETLVNVFKSLT